MWKEILEVLQNEQKYYEQLLLIVIKQVEMVKNGDKDGVIKLMKYQERMLTQLSLMENKKNVMINKIKKAHNIRADLYLTNLVKRFAEEPVKMQLLDAIADLLDKAVQIKRYTEMVQRGVHKEMQFMEFNINVLTSTVAGDTYAKEGGHTGAFRQRKMFDESI